MHNHTLFLTLNVFSATGGIEKVCRIAGKALYENSVQHNSRLMIWSMHDSNAVANDNAYFPVELFKGFAGKKAGFVKAAVQQGIQSKLVILSHINLLLVGWLIKKLSPKTRVVLMAHGIEIWNQLSTRKTVMLRAMDQLWAVSSFTRTKILEQHGLDAQRVAVLNNCLDPYLTANKNVIVPAGLRKRYGLAETDKILFTLTRLSSKEKYKGYVDVIAALQQLNDPAIKYIIAGKADDTELSFVKDTIEKAGLKNHVVLAGFIADEEVAAHYKMSDCYIMPSSGEGFGVSFIEAMYYGVPVIGGNADGSMDALMNGELGMAVKPGDIGTIADVIKTIMLQPGKYKPDHTKLENNFSYGAYKRRIEALLSAAH